MKWLKWVEIILIILLAGIVVYMYDQGFFSRHPSLKVPTIGVGGVIIGTILTHNFTSKRETDKLNKEKYQKLYASVIPMIYSFFDICTDFRRNKFVKKNVNERDLRDQIIEHIGKNIMYGTTKIMGQYSFVNTRKYFYDMSGFRSKVSDLELFMNVLDGLFILSKRTEILTQESLKQLNKYRILYFLWITLSNGDLVRSTMKVSLNFYIPDKFYTNRNYNRLKNYSRNKKWKFYKRSERDQNQLIDLLFDCIEDDKKGSFVDAFKRFDALSPFDDPKPTLWNIDLWLSDATSKVEGHIKRLEQIESRLSYICSSLSQNKADSSFKRIDNFGKWEITINGTSKILTESEILEAQGFFEEKTWLPKMREWCPLDMALTKWIDKNYKWLLFRPE